MSHDVVPQSQNILFVGRLHGGAMVDYPWDIIKFLTIANRTVFDKDQIIKTVGYSKHVRKC